MSMMSRKCPHCGKEIVQDDWIVVPVETWNSVAAGAEALSMKDKALDRLVPRLVDLEQECDKLKKAFVLLSSAIVNAGNPCFTPPINSEWPFRKGAPNA